MPDDTLDNYKQTLKVDTPKLEAEDKNSDDTIDVIMYTKYLCIYCMLARKLLKRKNINFKEISVSGRRKRWDEMKQKSGRNTVPQIFINNESLGGYDDIAALDRKGELDQKLGI